MKQSEQEQIHKLQSEGLGSTAIAMSLGMPLGTVKSFLRRQPMLLDARVCPQCGKAVKRSNGRRTKKFCSDQCRMAWWNSHPEQVHRKAFYHCTCVRCGKAFESYGNANRKYCSQDCYIAARREVRQHEG